MSLIVIVILALILFAYVAIPLLVPGQTDPLPDQRDPVKQDLEEERDALFRAIRELDAREDLDASRREQLRARYEAKAAKVLRTLDERQAVLDGQRPLVRQPRARKVPVTALSLLTIMVLTATVLSGYVLPRVGENASITTFFDGDLETATALRDLQRAAERNPTAENLLALGDAYWQLNEAEQAQQVYLQASETLTPVPAIAYQRLGFLSLQSDLNQGQTYLELAQQADPDNLDTLFALGEVYFAQDRLPDAINVWEHYLSLASNEDTTPINERLELARAVLPLAEAAQANPTEDALVALADAYWSRDAQEHATDVYFRVLTEVNPDNTEALSRVGQMLFFSSRTEDAISLLERARTLGSTELNTYLFLGNAYFSVGEDALAISAWQDYVELVGGEENAGRVPGLIADAMARLEGQDTVTPGDASGEASTGATDTPDTATSSTPAGDSATNDSATSDISAQALYQTNCAACHGATGQGGAGPRLAGNNRASNEANVRDVIRFGRGMMPGFGPSLTDAELDALTNYVITTIATGQ